MLPSQCNSYARNGLVDQPFYHYASDGHHYPSKRVKRLFYDPERVTGTDKVFSEYDWQTHTFSPTLRDLSTPQHNSPRFPQNPPSEATIVSKDKDGRGIKQGQGRISHVVPKPSSSKVPDEAFVSNYLLSTSQTTSYSSLSPPHPMNPDDDARHSHFYSMSPISQAHLSQSPLQESILAYAAVDLGCGSNVSRPAAPAAKTAMQRNQSPIWRSDATDAGVSQYPSSSGYFPRDGRDPRQLVLPPQGHLIWEGSDRKPRRQTSAPERRSRLPVIFEARSRSESRSDRNRHDHDQHNIRVHGGYRESSPFDDEEEDEQEERTPKEESRLAVLVSALHYQYVSVGMRIQLAVHRTEKKVARRLSDKRRKHDSTDGRSAGL